MAFVGPFFIVLCFFLAFGFGFQKSNLGGFKMFLKCFFCFGSFFKWFLGGLKCVCWFWGGFGVVRCFCVVVAAVAGLHDLKHLKQLTIFIRCGVFLVYWRKKGTLRKPF